MKRKVRIHGKINLMETSAVGIPAYPYAHASFNPDSFSLIKALTNLSLRPGFVEEREEIQSDELNLEEKEAMDENNPTPEVTETPVDAEEPKEPEKEPEEVAPEEKSEISSEIVKAIADGIKEGFKELETERGLVEKQIPVKKSLGELAMGMHNSAYGLGG